MKQKQLIAGFIGAAVFSLGAQAALTDRGNGMFYDDVLNITWLQDMSYVRTSGASVDGFMSWSDAKNWAANLEYGGFNDWRLPSAHLMGDSTKSFDGSTDIGYYNIRSEFGHLYYADLNNTVDPLNGGLTNISFIDAVTGQPKSFINMGDSGYWLDEPAEGGLGWIFDAWDGFQYRSLHLDDEPPLFAAIAVRSGDVAAVPLPAAAWFMAGSLLSLVGIQRRLTTNG